MKLHELLDWGAIAGQLKGCTNASSPALAAQDFMVFTDFKPSAGELPDASTICRFRNHLVKAELDQKLLALINGQLEQRGLKVQGARSAIIDATIIPSAARPRQQVDSQDE